MQPNSLPSELVAVAGIIDPAATAAGTVTTGWVDMSKFHALAAIILAGTLGASATLDAKLEQATSSSGAGAKIVTGKSITQLLQASAGSSKQVVINCVPGDLDIANSFRWVRLSMTVAVATSPIGGLLLGLYPRYDIATANDATSVTQVV